jgi:hypothetical protein
MKAKWLCAVALGLQAWASMSCAAGIASSASMEVSMRIVETCAIHASATEADSAQVSCVHGTPYQVTAAAVQAAAPLTEHHDATATTPEVVTVAF